ncbi:MAG: hypothetical protein HZA62_09905 [Rhodocyclales bacterium]|nr:hypothetical protein [Rhodocyclales bacterium]
MKHRDSMCSVEPSPHCQVGTFRVSPGKRPAGFDGPAENGFRTGSTREWSPWPGQSIRRDQAGDDGDVDLFRSSVGPMPGNCQETES